MAELMNNNNDQELQGPIVVPYTRLSPEVLDGVLDDFVLREGTEYGEEEQTLAAKKLQVMEMLHAGKAEVCFDPATETTTLRLK